MKKGFTLAELIVVISIIGILAAIMIVGISQSKQKSRDTKRIADVSAIQTAVELYYEKNGSYPNVTTCSAWTGTTPQRYICDSNDSTEWSALQTVLNSYIAVVPKDPVNNTATLTCDDTSTNTKRQRYLYISDGLQYKLITTHMETPSGQQRADNENDGSTSTTASRDCEYELFSLGARTW